MFYSTCTVICCSLAQYSIICIVYFMLFIYFCEHRSVNVHIHFIANGQQHGDLRLMDGLVQSQIYGRLEIFDANTNQWGTICNDGFALFSANTACKQLGHAGAERFGTAVDLG